MAEWRNAGLAEGAQLETRKSPRSIGTGPGTQCEFGDCVPIGDNFTGTTALRKRWSSWLSALRSSPWLVSWIFPLGPVSGVAGVGPAGSVAWNPKTGNLCISLGAGLSVGDSLAAGPVQGKTTDGKPASPKQIDDIFRGWSSSVGYNVPLGPVPAGPGIQVTGNGSGVVYGPTGGVAGGSMSSTLAVCTK